MNIKCLWSGHQHKESADYYDGDSFIWVCQRCGSELDYYDIHDPCNYPIKDRIKDFIVYWFFRKWFPCKCDYCGNRYKCDDSIDHIPF